MAVEVVFRVDETDARLPKIVEVLQSALRGQPDATPGAAATSQAGRDDLPPYIKLLLEYDRRGGRVPFDASWAVNAKAYKDPRGAGGMYTKTAGYFHWDEDTKTYELTEKGRTTLREYLEARGEPLRDTTYAKELARGVSGDARVERLKIKATEREEIRFSWWKDDQLMMRPLDLPEDELLTLFQSGIKGGVFSSEFLRALRDIVTLPK